MTDLHGLAVLVTRPVRQAAGLADQVERLGGEAVRYPLIDIQPPSDLTNLQNLPTTIRYADLAVFISANAVEFACRQMTEVADTFPDSCLVAAIGKTTARRLADYGIHVDLVPLNSQDSEGLLELPELQLLTDASVVILRGEGGRKLLGDTFRERGAFVQYCNCYRRQLPETDVQPLVALWQNGGINVVTATSVATVDNLLKLLGEKDRSLALDTPVIVVSDRVAQHCAALGWLAEIVVAEGASNNAVSNALLRWRGSDR